MIKKEELAIRSVFLECGQIIQAVVGFAVNLVLVRYLAPKNLGALRLL